MQHSGRQGRLNSFQKTILQWSTLQAYNAVHALRIAAASLDVDRLNRVISATLTRRGLTRFQYDSAHYSFGDTPPAFTVKCLQGGGRPETIAEEIERQINAPFEASQGVDPFRFFAVPDADGFFLGLVYFHAVADAESIVLLMKELAEEYQGIQPGSAVPAPDLYATSGGVGFGAGPGLLAGKLLALPGRWRDLRHSCRPLAQNPLDLTNKFSLITLAPQQLQALIQSATAWNVTVNDVLLALLLIAVGPLATDRFTEPKRRKISVGNIVNTRRDLQLEGGRVFGLFLGFFVVTHAVPPDCSLRQLAQDVGLQTSAVKKDKLYLSMGLELAFGRMIFSFYSPERRKKFYAKNYPLWGGISNMNVNSLWPAQQSAPLNYIRAVSTGPVTPLVLSVTTSAQSVNIGLSWRPGVFSAPQIEQFKDGFLSALRDLASN